MLAGNLDGNKIDLNTLFEGVGAVAGGTMTEEELAEVSPGVRALVKWLNDQMFITCDSGDGSNYEEGMGCALPIPMIAIQSNPNDIWYSSRRLLRLLRERGVNFDRPEWGCNSGDEIPTFPQITASYDPNDDSALILLSNVTSDMAGL